jgi:hypothetical protein
MYYKLDMILCLVNLHGMNMQERSRSAHVHNMALRTCSGAFFLTSRKVSTVPSHHHNQYQLAKVSAFKSISPSYLLASTTIHVNWPAARNCSALIAPWVEPTDLVAEAANSDQMVD